MKLSWGVATAAVLALVAAPIAAQSLMAQAKGTWHTRTPACGDQTLTIADVDANTGIIKGTFYCGRMNITATFAEQIVPGKSMVGKIEGDKLNIKGSVSYQNLTFTGGKLTGPSAGAGFSEIIISYEKK